MRAGRLTMVSPVSASWRTLVWPIRALARAAHDIEVGNYNGERMASEATVDCGWGRLIFGQTYASPERLAEEIRREAPGSSFTYEPGRDAANVQLVAVGRVQDVGQGVRLVFRADAVGHRVDGEHDEDKPRRRVTWRRPTQH